MSSTRRRFHVKHPVVVDIGCNCRKPNLSSLFNLRRTHKYYPSAFSPSASSLATTKSTTTPSLSPSDFSSPMKKKKKKKKGVVEESVAVEKESSDPYLDFRDSMLNMIVEKEIYNWDELKELLHLFLSLNSPCHHRLILRAFAEIWNGVPSPGERGGDRTA